MKNLKLFTSIFVLITIADLLSITYMPQARNFTKPIILLSLIYWYSSSSSMNKSFVIALMFSLVGDIFLLFEGELFFILGLGSFLISHILYISVILKAEKSGKINYTKLTLCFIPFLLLFSYIFTLIYPKLEQMLMPVVVYASTIAIFGSLSLYFYIVNKKISNLYLLVGAVLFVSSDAILSTQLFHYPHFIKELLIMSTYAFAQYFLVRYMLEKIKQKL
ncbi:MAG: lysoplasmalogenase [Flavobacteriaceae bacterium]|nr:lysoplasmalogenase [Flavobacteriaceae bacterium]